MAEEKELDLILGQDRFRGGIHYKTLFFESHIERVLSYPKFRLRGLYLAAPKLQQKDNKSYIVRISNKDKENTYCRYVRSPSAEIYGSEDWNNYEKITERFDFINGYTFVCLRKGDYFITFQYVGDKANAWQAAREGFKSFQDLAKTVEPNILNRLADPEIIGTNRLKINFGSKKDKLPLEFEFILQDEILFKFLQMAK